MKRLLTLVLMASAVLMAVPAFAAVQGSPHDYVATTYGRCGICHVPHAALGAKRLWRVSPTASGTGTGWDNSNVGSLCASCHNGGTLTGQNAAGVNPHPVGATVYAATSHGRDTNVLVGAGPTHLSGTRPSGNPYMSGLMECTSCHNVHFEGTFAAGDVKRPFLRGASVGTTSGFCAGCHNDRLNDAAGTGGIRALNTSGNHPVNIAYAGQAATLVAVADMPAGMKVAVANNQWSLGGKFEGVLTGAPTASNNIGCQTCHAVHNPASGTDQANHLLAVNNVAAAAALCEGCHGNPTGNAARQNSGAQMMVGTTSGDHPIDIAIASPGPDIDRWYMVAASTARAERHATDYGSEAGKTNAWPRGTSGNIVCTSCHSAHRAFTGDVGASGRGGRLTRTDSSNAFCNACHSDPSPAGHHTHSGNTGTINGVFYSTNASSLTCSSCHGSSTDGTFAHNGFNYNANFVGSIASNNASQVCNYCHLTAGSTASNDKDPVFSTAALPADHLGASSADQTMKSHYLGGIGSAATITNVKRSTWGAGFSKYGAAADTHGASSDTTGSTVVCESCHSVLHNAGTGSGATKTSGYMVNLLLQNYQDDGSGTKDGTGVAAIGSGFCVACHNQNNVGSADGAVADSTVLDKTIVPAGTHPMTSWSITRAQDAGRSITTLVTTAGDGTYADKSGAPGAGSYPAQDKMDCDSCHRPHRAPANSTYDQTQGHTGTAVPIILEKQTAANEWSVLCQECHNM